MERACAGKEQMRRPLRLFLLHLHISFRTEVSSARGGVWRYWMWRDNITPRIIEDDYDSEFRYSGEPVPAMLRMINHAPLFIWVHSAKTLFLPLRNGVYGFPRRWRKARLAIASLLRGKIAPSSVPWRCSQKRATMRAIWQPCASSLS